MICSFIFDCCLIYRFPLLFNFAFFNMQAVGDAWLCKICCLKRRNLILIHWNSCLLTTVMLLQLALPLYYVCFSFHFCVAGHIKKSDLVSYITCFSWRWILVYFVPVRLLFLLYLVQFFLVPLLTWLWCRIYSLLCLCLF